MILRPKNLLAVRERDFHLKRRTLDLENTNCSRVVFNKASTKTQESRFLEAER